MGAVPLIGWGGNKRLYKKKKKDKHGRKKIWGNLGRRGEKKKAK